MENSLTEFPAQRQLNRESEFSNPNPNPNPRLIITIFLGKDNESKFLFFPYEKTLYETLGTYKTRGKTGTLTF